MRDVYLSLLLLGFLASARPAEVDQEAVQAAATAPVLTCVQEALGGTAAIGGVASLYIRAQTKPTREAGPRPLPGTREISVVFPDQYLRADTAGPGEGGMYSTVGFSRDTILSNPGARDAIRGVHAAHRDFSRQMLMRFPAGADGVSLVQRATEANSDPVAIDASDTHGFQATLLVDRDTCVPIAVEYMAVGAVRGVRRIDLAEYRSFGGILFPTVLTTTIDGRPWMEERVTTIEVNTPTANGVFAGRSD